ncbi:MAG: adenylate/guanylate cyclase domain-containing protein [Chloroflexi bacterium]|nr:adenylate/guanylate cyclase domain-containing protein [Chloroflexota bacterium]
MATPAPTTSDRPRKFQSNWQRFVSRRILTAQHPARRLLRGVLIGIVVALMVSFALYRDWFLDIRLSLKDNLYSSAPTSGNIVIIAVDDKSLAALGRSPADWNRAKHAQLIQFLAQADARVVTFDLFFDVASEDTAEDAALVDAMNEACQPTPLGTCRGTEVILAAVGGQLIDTEQTSTVGTYSFISHPTDALDKAAGRLGHVTVHLDRDGSLRDVPLFIQTIDGEQIPTLGLASYLSYQRLDDASVRYEDGELRFYIDPASPEYTVVRKLPAENFARMLVYYFGEPSHIDEANSTYPVYSYIDVLEGRVPAEDFANKVVLVGVLDASALPDRFPVPIAPANDRMYGVEFHANVIETIYQSDDKAARTAGLKVPPVPQSTRSEYMVVALFALMAGMLFSFLRWYMTLVAALLAYFLFFIYAGLAFTNGRLLEIFFPGMTLVLVFVGTVISNYVFEERRRAEINDLFSRYVSTDIAQKILESYDRGELELGGEEREMTVMFADVRGFTTLSEGLPPHEVVRMLNLFLERMNEIVLKHGGAINKYIGDNLMAFWNAPYFQDDHAWKATQAALELLEAIKDINAEQQFKTPVQFGIGINTGIAVVGNIGSQQRLEYTPIGDTVNVASRLSGVAEGGACLVGPGTYIYLAERLQPARQISVRLKGKAQELVVYEFRPQA